MLLKSRAAVQKITLCFKFTFFILSLIMITTGCSHSLSSIDNSPPLQDETKLVTLSDELWGTVQLDSVSARNLLKLMEGLTPSDIRLDTIIEGAGINGEIQDEKGKKQIRILYDLTIIDNKIFEGPSAKAIFNLAEQKVYSTNQLSKVIEKCDNIQLEANDLSKKLDIHNSHELVTAIKEAEKIKDDTEQMVISSGEKYPDYTITLGLGSENITIHLLSQKYFYIIEPNAVRVYNSSNSLWNYCEKKLPYPQPTLDSLAFLFTANSLECNEEGNLNHRKLAIARLLQKGVFQENIKITEPHYHLTFTFDQENINVVISENAFEYNGKTFRLENVGTDFQGLISAG